MALLVLLNQILSYVVVRIIETGANRYVRTPNIPACLYACAVGALFALIVNLIALRKVKHLNLTNVSGKKYTKICKPTFGSVELAEKLKGCDQHNTEVMLIGLCTDICVVSNALLLKANYPEMNISVDAGCCAGVTPESHHAALTTMKMCQIDVIGE